MPKQKYNWHKIKKEFMASEYTEVKPFMEIEYGKYTGTITSNTTGWGDEKRKMLSKATDKAIEKIADKFSEDVAKGLTNVVYSLMADMTDGDVSDKKKIWEVLRTEAGKPTKIDKSDVNHTHRGFWDDIDDVDEKELKKELNEYKNHKQKQDEKLDDQLS